jgi:Tetracyclin repressor-like, C-terminal domain
VRRQAGLVRELFFAGFRLLHERLAELEETDDARADLLALCARYRDFVRGHPALAQVMIARPFSDFDPSAAEGEAGRAVRKLIVVRVRRAIAAGALYGEASDVAHALVALVQGLALAETARRLGSTRASIDRRWRLAVTAMIDGLSRPRGVR